ncbi:GntR family transcriptional regulator [Streptomyces sp. SAJ15]|uniref:GntR family transcriptional regulator n=1 Tax=Streptomyces sp. SAJ15 TaxID=2011095 RepID=UPI0011864BA4|nr:winged helix-turn-helix domain-containing protein [Streptomyces sp. SAJ15]TVL88511.1 GntR family transcriptional regulator [Streptomyces sp. SAJ15]
MRNEAVQPYQRIVQDYSEKIRLGQLAAGTKLPSTRELADEYGVAPGTVQRALTELRTARLIYSHQGRGSFVSDTSSNADQDPTTRSIKALEAQVAELAARLDKIEKGRDD